MSENKKDQEANFQDKRSIGLLKDRQMNRDEKHLERLLDEAPSGGHRSQDSSQTQDERSPTAKRGDYQLGRRLFHFGSGFLVASFYTLFLTHKQIVYILGTLACLLYLFEQIRLNYPELAQKMLWVNKLLLRAEEQLKESAAVPYTMAILLTILTFPKVVALIAIFTLAIGDPLSAIVGIRFGKHRLVPGKSLEGTGAFFLSSTFVTYGVLGIYLQNFGLKTFATSMVIGLVSAVFETLPIRIDDNLTIPLFTAATAWVILAALGVLL